MEFTETDYILGVWVAHNRKKDNFVQTVKRHREDQNKWDLEYRFRYNKNDSSPWSNEDEKKFYNGTITDTEENVEFKLNKVFEAVKIVFPEGAKYIPVKGDFNKMMFLLAQEDDFHLKQFNTKDPESLKEFEQLKKRYE